MTSSNNNEVGIKLLEQRVTNIESNMSTKSDIKLVSQKIDTVVEGFGAVDRLAEKVGDMVTQIAKKEETDKHLQAAQEKLEKTVKDHDTELQKIKEYIAADKPYRETRGWIVKGVITFIVAGVLGTVFVVTK
jgi:hypothetical protein